MNWEAISAIGQIVGAIGVVVSLVYLAREIRTNARAARHASMETLVRWLGQLAEQPHLAELYYRGIHDFESLEGADLVRFGVLMNQFFHIVNEMYYQHFEGIWIHACGVRSKHLFARSTHIPEFRLGGVYARIGSVKTLRSTPISYSRRLSLPRCIANQVQINDLTNR